MPKQKTEEFDVSCQEAASELKCSYMTMIRKAEANQIPHEKRGGKSKPRYWFRASDIAKLKKAYGIIESLAELCHSG